ncbi:MULTISPECIES: EutN/CcmL family microcompartment protein [Desulfosporosinus]|uniref:Ethanolamine utilization protein EutN n=2 Tax=Desulfosporosinus TaxID=79206 RepID=A0A1M5RI04_9FIRM|nr:MULTISPECIES: EutN/CcmL family microcompartment protein [Desulfosporosinus]MDA8223660.1 EutN/CcmL family microcompartment protein [Desulfitobacterium hafniense]MCB8817781.1 EutN/CcmL family microcompartment protein [Desulfosporosinus sp. SRJS8]MCO1603632.1 EutN/CcmL family microcompartment protein [Desulfosporosinus nitroreducens]MCO5386014.1 EutN/CcmL family microcompartment protein [Desulfosporosinus sp.]MDO0822155.1 EutN/CcmL family microcompartment protein [Desulfosporosinus nitroreduce
MIAAKVIDSIWSTRKADSLVGLKFMLVEVLGGIDAGRLMIAADTISAGVGERVIVCNGSSARKMLGREDVPIDAVIVGIIDEDCKF